MQSCPSTVQELYFYFLAQRVKKGLDDFITGRQGYLILAERFFTRKSELHLKRGFLKWSLKDAAEFWGLLELPSLVQTKSHYLSFYLLVFYESCLR